MLIFQNWIPPESSVLGTLRHMIRFVRRALTVVNILFLVALPIVALEASGQEAELKHLKELKEQAENNDAMDSVLHTRLLELYDQVINDLPASQQAETRIAENKHARANTVQAKGSGSEQEREIPSLNGKSVKEIRISDLRFTKPEIITRELASKVGEPYKQENGEKDLERLDRLGIFSSIEVKAFQENDEIVVDVRVTETFPYLPTLSLNITEETGVSAGPGFKSVNLFGQDVSLSIAARFGGATDAQLYLENPWFAGNHASYRIEFFYLDRLNRLDDFNEHSFELNLRMGSYIGENVRIGGELGLLQMESDVDGITLSEDNRDNIPGLAFFIGYDSRDLWSNPHQGWWNEFKVMNRGGILGGDGNYFTFNFDVRRYQPIRERHTLAFFSLTTLQTGKVGIDIPVHQDFHLGGTNTIRGWSLNSSVGKNQFINTAEYRFALMKPRKFSFKGIAAYLGVQVAAFTDFGIAWNQSHDFNLENFIGSIGMGVRFLVPFIDVLRLDLAYGETGQGVSGHLGVNPKSVRQRQRVR